MKILASHVSGPKEVEAEEAFTMYGFKWMVYNDPEAILTGKFTGPFEETVDDWYVIEYHTGRGANMYGQFTKEQAIASAKERLERVGEKQAKEIIKKHKTLNK